MHALVDAQGRPIRGVVRLTRRLPDIASAPEMLASLREGATLLTDKGYEADALRRAACARKTWANIPPKANRKDPICFSPHL
ncbi:transposase [Mesorhizobium sp. AR02]|uniref:transposase n=1 Tax=Mesorhizobium sp. AR02 TaxID=2865837 RepID=UPI003A5C22CE